MSRGRLRFSVTLAAFAAAVFFTYREEVLGAALAPLTAWTAQATASVLELLDAKVARQATILRHPGGFAYEIYFRCTGILPVACLGVVILAHPAGTRRKKLAGLAVGIPLLLALNLVRLVHLFWIGVAWPEVFDLAHVVVWNFAIMVAVLGFWLVWLSWARALPAKRVAGAPYRSRPAGETPMGER